jgi:Leucine-rich repeat (LRR) protein
MVCNASDNLNKVISSDNEKKHSIRKYILPAGIILLLVISALVFICFTQEPKPDPESEKIILEAVAKQLNKDPNELTDEDFRSIKELSLPIIKNSSPLELSDIKIIEKCTNLQELDMSAIRYPDKNIPKWMKLLAKVGVFNLYKRFAIDLSPMKNLSSLKTLNLSSTQISDITSLKGLVNIEDLFIDNTRVSDFEPLRGLINLQNLSISETQVSSLEPIRNLKKLQTLIMINCKNVTDEQIKDLKNSLPELKIYR